MSSYCYRPILQFHHLRGRHLPQRPPANLSSTLASSSFLSLFLEILSPTQLPMAAVSAAFFGSKIENGTAVVILSYEKKDLASYAHSLGKKLKCQLVGKSGVIAASFIETLEANELLKIKIHRTSPGELDDVVSQLEMLTGSVVVSQIGRTTIIYKPSLTKLKAVEKKKQATRVFMNRAGTTQKPALAMCVTVPGFPARLTALVDPISRGLRHTAD
ncbi:hypothetical protein SAY87_014357 [Trapa incisa]|uniref:CRM domain-containing protein n=1 Tax=Trapa incisa TaxID=236973 RepID=A0AAN7JDA8_9MYRT|nr:hypothetical protein SAY87_014357 [Trapa incisa]